MNPWAAIAITLILLVVSGFFVASEFALVGARRHRLEQAAAAHRRGARSALNGVRELSLMLAGAQLGITMCIVGLGMISEPALHHLLEPPTAALGLPDVAADAVALVAALSLVTFLHVVIGEMAPKSWAIAHPESSALLLAPAFRAFTWAVRWLLVVLNGMSNAVLRLFRVQPRDSIVNVRNREQIHHLVEESERLGLISSADHGLLTRALDAPASPVGALGVRADQIVAVGADAAPAEVVERAAASGRTRLIVWGTGGEVAGTVHVRDALLARAAGADRTAGEMATPVPLLAPDAGVAAALRDLQRGRAQLGVVADAAAGVVGLVSLDDLLGQILTA
ncbi:MAG: CNNM domain-containing protein [Jiangellaceae bacterium]